MPYQIDVNKKFVAEPSHGSALIAGFTQMFQIPILSFFFVFIITFALFLPAGFYVLKRNLNVLDSAWNQTAEILVYLKKDVGLKVASGLAGELKNNSAIMHVKLISPEEGMKDFVKRTGFGEILLGVKANPLPSVIVIQPKLNKLSLDHIVALIDKIKNFPEVDLVKVDLDWVKQSFSFLTLIDQLSSILIIFFNVSAILIICFMSYLMPQLIASKIVTSKRILQYQCFWYSLIGGIAALGFVNLILILLARSGLVLQGLGMGISVGFVLIGILLTTIISGFMVNE